MLAAIPPCLTIPVAEARTVWQAEINLAGGSETDIVGHSVPAFSDCNPEELASFLQAPQRRRPDVVAASLDDHPKGALSLSV